MISPLKGGLSLAKRHPGRPKGKKKTCKLLGCEKASHARGLCHTHYMAHRRGLLNEDGTEARPRQRALPYGPDAVCIVKGCKGRPKGRGLCNKHLLLHRAGQLDIDTPSVGFRKSTVRHASRCIVKGCSRRPSNRSMCTTHAQQRIVGILDEQGNRLREPRNPGARRRPEGWRKVDAQGYVLVVAPEDHPRARADGTILEHRLVVEGVLDRHLEEWEVVHHRDGERTNNNIENLQLLDGRAGKDEGHPPASEMDYLTAVQVVAQDERTPVHVRRSLRKLQRTLAN